MIHYRGYDWSPAARYANHFAPCARRRHIHPHPVLTVPDLLRAYPREQRRAPRCPLVHALQRNSSSLEVGVRSNIIAAKLNNYLDTC